MGSLFLVCFAVLHSGVAWAELHYIDENLPVIVRTEAVVSGSDAQLLMNLLQTNQNQVRWISHSQSPVFEMDYVKGYRFRLDAWDDNTTLAIRCDNYTGIGPECLIRTQYKTGHGSSSVLVQKSSAGEIVAPISEKYFPGLRDFLFLNLTNFKDEQGAAGPIKVVKVQAKDFSVRIFCYENSQNGDCRIGLRFEH